MEATKLDLLQQLIDRSMHDPALPDLCVRLYYCDRIRVSPLSICACAGELCQVQGMQQQDSYYASHWSMSKKWTQLALLS